MDSDKVRAIVETVVKKHLEASEPSKGSLREQNNARWLNSTSTQNWTKKKTPKKAENLTHASNCAAKNFIPSPENAGDICPILESTPARIGVWRAGTRYLTRVALKLRADHAIAKDAVYAELPKDFGISWGWIPLKTKAKDKEEFLLRPDLGRQLDDSSLQTVKSKGVPGVDVQITVADGLSSWAAERYAKPMIDTLLPLFKSKNMTVGPVFVVRYSRIAIQDVIGQTLNAKVSLILLGERPGLGTGDSLSNYMIYGPYEGAVNAKKSMISNIHPLGYKPEEAARITFEMVLKMFEQKCSGIELKV